MTPRRFTLVELMIVVAIIGILAAIAIPAFRDMQLRAKVSEVPIVLDGIGTAYATYEVTSGLDMSLHVMTTSWNPNVTPSKGRFAWNLGLTASDVKKWSEVGFAPDGEVYGVYRFQLPTLYCPYSVETYVVGMTDVDGDGAVNTTYCCSAGGAFTYSGAGWDHLPEGCIDLGGRIY